MVTFLIIAIIEFNLDGYILDANEKFQNLMGYSLDELIGNHHSMFIPYHLKESEEYSNFWKNILNGQFENGEFKRITKNEKEIWISGSYNPIYNESNQLIKIIKTAIDITKEKLQSEELRQSNLAILNSNLVIEFETDGRIIGANKKFLDLIGYSLEEITGKFYSFITPQDVKNYVDYLAFWDGFKNGNYQAGVFEILGKNNSLFYIRGTFNPILDSMGNPYKIITHAMDITTERIANIHTREIFQSIDRYAAYIEFDLAGNIIFANDGFLKTMKYSKAELQHKTHSIFLINSEVNSIEAENFWKDLTSGIFKSGDYLRINKFGKEVWIRGSYHPIFDKNGKPYKIIKYAIDITQHVLAEERMKKVELEIIEAEKAKANFLYTMSHEIRNPLNGIIGMSKILQESNLNEDQKECSELIYESGQTLLELINDILDFGKIDSGKLDIEEIPFNLIESIQGIMRPLELVKKHKSVELIFEFNECDNLVIGDEGKIRQIITNLLSNSLKFTSQGFVKLILTISSIAEFSLIKIEVSDTGVGIPEAAKSKMFEAFSQAEKSTTRKFGGTGLGLSISKSIIEKMGGRISFASEENKGTSFFIEFKLKTGAKITEANNKEITVKKIENLYIGRVLIAEDNITNQVVISRMLEIFRCHFHVVSNGKEVLDELKLKQYDLILMDCQMPEMDGFHASKLIRASNADFAQIPIVALTANTSTEDENKCLAEGMNEVITKPIDMNKLENIIKKFLKKNNGSDKVA